MTLSVSNLKYESAGSEIRVTGAIAFDNSYPTGGEVLNASQLGIAMINRIRLEPEGGYLFEPVYTSSKLSVNIKARQSSHTHTENTAAIYTQNATTAAGQGFTEVANATDLSALTAVEFDACGY